MDSFMCEAQTNIKGNHKEKNFVTGTFPLMFLRFGRVVHSVTVCYVEQFSILLSVI